MFSAFWGSIAIVAVKDLLIKPQTSQLMADLLEITVTEFLLLTQSYTLPWLVLTKKTDVIRKIAQARRDDDPWMTCLDTSNSVPILALLLVQNVPDTESYILSLLKCVSPRFKDLDFTHTLRAEPALIALELLKAAGEADESKKSRVCSPCRWWYSMANQLQIQYALQFLASRTHLAAGDGSHKKSNPVGLFLEQHILGLITRLSDVINDSWDDQSFPEKRRCVKAVEEAIKVGKTSTRSARTQVIIPPDVQRVMIKWQLIYDTDMCLFAVGPVSERTSRTSLLGMGNYAHLS
jgi:serine/threonine-protein kinase ATR